MANLLTLFLLEGAFHIAWSMIEDNVTPLRRLTHGNTVNESTKLLVIELQELGALPHDRRNAFASKHSNEQRQTRSPIFLQRLSSEKMQRDSRV
jgi:hypothetical protein